MDDPSRFTSINEYYTFIYAISYMMFSRAWYMDLQFQRLAEKAGQEKQ